MKSYGNPIYTQQEYDLASAQYFQYRVNRLEPGEPIPTSMARLPLARPQYGRWFAGVCKGISMHLGISVALVRLFFFAASFMFGAGLIAYMFLWMIVPVGDPVWQAYALASRQPVSQSPLAKGNAPYGTYGPGSIPQSQEADFLTENNAHANGESLGHVLKTAPKPALLAMTGMVLIAAACLMLSSGITPALVFPLLTGMVGVGVSWLRYNAKDGQLWTMIGGITIIFVGYAMYIGSVLHPLSGVEHSTLTFIVAGFALLVGVILAIVPWIVALIRDLGTERALKEREEERADMTAHLHDGVLQTLALIQLHADDQQTVFSLARSQERELREWLYQERTTSDRSVSAGLKDIAAQIEDSHGKPIEVVTVGDARPSAQTDALLNATQQALVNAVTHGGEPVSVYCEASDTLVEVFVRDHGEGFDIKSIPPNRLGIRESIIGRIKRRGGTVEIVSRPKWGTEVRMHMPISAKRARTNESNANQAKEQQ